MAGTYYAVRKGRRPGIYDNWNDCRRQVDGYAGNQYKSFTSLKEAQAYIAEDTHSPQPLFSKQDGGFSFDNFVPTIFSSDDPCFHGGGYSSNCNTSLASRASASQPPEVQITTKKQGVHFLEFDGASKGNPGTAGAGAVLRNPDRSMLCRIIEGVGVATNNVAEYRAIIRGLKFCLSQGIDRIHVRGDSNLVCMQIQDKWQTRNANIADLSNEAKQLKSKFKEFHIEHVLREFNSDADAAANEAISLPDGEWRCYWAVRGKGMS